jgi:hypothetical protein
MLQERQYPVRIFSVASIKAAQGEFVAAYRSQHP